MDIQFEKIGNVSAKITINMAKEDYEAKVTKTLKDFSHKAQMPGFRPGKVPMSLVRKLYGVQAKAEEVNKLLQDSLFNYIKENKVNMLGEPLGSDGQEPQDIEKQDDFTFIFDIALVPEFKAEIGEDDTIDYYDIEVPEESVTKQLDAMRQQHGHPESQETYEDRDILRGTLAELDENGQPKENGIVEGQSSLMPTYFKNDDQKKIFEGVTKNTVVTFNPTTAYEANETELASLLKIKKEEVGEHKGDFSFQINEISRFVPAELNEDFFEKAFGKGTVKNEEEARAKVRADIAAVQQHDSDYKFLLDVRAHMEQKVGALEFADELLKRIMKANNKDKDEKFVEDNYAKSIDELRWHLIKEQLVQTYGIKVSEQDIKQAAIQAARYQFAQYGMSNVPNEYLENYAQEMLKRKEQSQALAERCIDAKLTAALKNAVKLNHKPVSSEEFGKMFEEKQA